MASRRGEEGYILLTLLLIICLMIIFAAAIVPSITFNIKRDREEELIHRGVQYSRAIRAYYKKFGRYPTKIEDLENTNNLRFLRKRYKDPLTGQDFKLLHFGDVKLTFSGGAGGGGINGASSLNGTPFGQQPQQPGGLGGGGLNGGGGLSNSGGFGSSQNSFGSNSNTTPGTNQTTTPDQTQNGPSDSNPQSPNSPSGQPDANGADKLAGVTFGGGPVVGVASASKKETIREFNHKKKYNEWQFIYDPATDRGGLLMTPNQPAIQGFGQQGAPNVNGIGTGFGNGSSPTGLGMQNSPSSPLGGAPATTSEPSGPPPQQQQQPQQ